MSRREGAPVDLHLPSGLVGGDTLFIYTPTAAPSQPTGSLTPAGGNFVLHAQDTSSGAAEHQFPIAYTLRVPYDPALLPVGVDESTVNLYYFDTTRGRWTLIPATRSLSRHTLTAQVDHLTEFAMLSDTGGGGGAGATPELPSFALFVAAAMVALAGFARVRHRRA